MGIFVHPIPNALQELQVYNDKNRNHGIIQIKINSPKSKLTLMKNNNEIAEFCAKHNLTEDRFLGKEKIGGNLYLGSLTSIPEGFNPTVGGYLDLGSLTSIPEGFNPTVGGNLYLRSLTSIPEGFNPTVGGYLYLRNGLSAPTKKPGKLNTPKNKLLFWKDGKFVKADGIFTEVVSKKGNVYRVKKLHSQKEFYLVTDGTTHSHGDTLKQAKEDFRFKLIAEKLKADPIKPNTKITMQYYRIVTGACEAGCKMFIEQNKLSKKENTAKELLPILEKNNAYGLERFKQLITF